MKVEKIWEKRFLSFGLLIYFTSGIVTGTILLHPYRQYFLFIGIILIYLSVGHVSNVRNMWLCSGTIHKLYYMFGVSIFLALFNNMEAGIALSGSGIILTGLASMSWAPQAMVAHNYSYAKLFKWLIFIHCLAFGFSIITRGIQFSRYEGVFRNPNGMGNAAFMFCTITIILYLILLTKKEVKGITNISFIVLLALSLFFATVANCRGATVCILINIVVFIIILLKNGMDKQKKVRSDSIALLLLLVIVGIFLLCFTNMSNLFEENIIGKFERVSEEGDVFNGRTETWQTIVGRIKMFGNGEYAELAAHNAFLSMLDQYGILAFITWSLFNIAGLLRSIKEVFWENKTGIYYIPLFAFLTFIELGMVEGGMLSTAMFLAVFSVGILEPPTNTVRNYLERL